MTDLRAARYRSRANWIGPEPDSVLRSVRSLNTTQLRFDFVEVTMVKKPLREMLEMPKNVHQKRHAADAMTRQVTQNNCMDLTRSQITSEETMGSS